jgi:hypothetical protein
VVDDIGYSQEITDNVRGFIAVRLSSLRLGTTGRFLEGGHPLDLDALLRSNVVFEIEDVGDDRDKAFLMGTVLIRLVEHLRLDQKHHGASNGLRHLSVFEEAHRLLQRIELLLIVPAQAGGRLKLANPLVRLAHLLLMAGDQVPQRRLAAQDLRVEVHR